MKMIADEHVNITNACHLLQATDEAGHVGLITPAATPKIDAIDCKIKHEQDAWLRPIPPGRLPGVVGKCDPMYSNPLPSSDRLRPTFFAKIHPGAAGGLLRSGPAHPHSSPAAHRAPHRSPQGCPQRVLR